MSGARFPEKNRDQILDLIRRRYGSCKAKEVAAELRPLWPNVTETAVRNLAAAHGIKAAKQNAQPVLAPRRFRPGGAT